MAASRSRGGSRRSAEHAGGMFLDAAGRELETPLWRPQAGTVLSGVGLGGGHPAAGKEPKGRLLGGRSHSDSWPGCLMDKRVDF